MQYFEAGTTYIKETDALAKDGKGCPMGFKQSKKMQWKSENKLLELFYL